MRKADIANEIYEKVGVSKKEAADIVEFILNLLAEGWSTEMILENYPGLTQDQIRACLAYARDRLSEEQVFTSPA